MRVVKKLCNPLWIYYIASELWPFQSLV